MKLINLFVLSLFLYVFLFSSHFIGTFAQEINVEGKKVDYNLPYPGILPDNPLYSVKSLRDKLWLFFIRDYTKKSELLLLFSDKKTAMAQELSSKGKWSLGSEYMLLAERDFEKLVSVMNNAKKQGASPQGDFILRAKLSNEKHREIIEDVLIKTPQGERTNLEEALKLNERLQQKLSKL